MDHFVSLLLLVALMTGGSLADCVWDRPVTEAWSTYVTATAGENVVIPSGVTLLYDLTTSPVYGNITLNGIVYFANAATALDAEGIIISDGGELWIGSECCPATAKSIITLYGDPSESVYVYGKKMIAVLDGRLELHGSNNGPSWTKLAGSVVVGATSFTVTDPVSWLPGDSIALASTDYAWDSIDETTVVSVSGDGLTVTVADPMLYNHFGEITFGVDERGEVAHLTRNIVVQGADDSGTANGFGAHMMFFAPLLGVRLSNVEVTLSGQAGLLARYPVHFHLAGDVAGRAYVKDCAIHHNFQRSLTIHGTDSLEVYRTVMYMTRGHSLFIEDGIEVNNQIKWCLGFGVSETDYDNALIFGDSSSPAVFWITNPNNTLEYNTAAGGSGPGFWYALPVHPMGPSYTETVWPQTIPLQSFAFNTAHSTSTYMGALHVDDAPPLGGTSNYSPQLAEDVPAPAYFRNFNAYRCQFRCIWMRGTDLIVTDSRFGDMAIGTTFAANTRGCDVYDSLYVGETDNMGTPGPEWQTHGLDGRTLPLWYEPSWPIRGAEFYDGPVLQSNNKFVNFVPNSQRNASGTGVLRADEFDLAPTNAAEFAFFLDAKPFYMADTENDGDKNAVFGDTTGHYTGRPAVGQFKATVTAASPFFRTPSCYEVEEWAAYVCPNHFASLSFSPPEDFETSMFPDLDGTNLFIYRDDNAQPMVLCGTGGFCNDLLDPAPPTSFTSQVVLQHTYYVDFDFNPMTTLEVRLMYADKTTWWSGDDTFIIVGLCYPPGTTVSELMWNWQDASLVQAPSFSAMVDQGNDQEWADRGTNMWFVDTDSGYVFVKLMPYEARTEETLRLAWPAGVASLTFDVPSGLANAPATCTRPSTITPMMEDAGLPPVSAREPFPAWNPPQPSLPWRFDADVFSSEECSSVPSVSPTECGGGSCAESVFATNPYEGATGSDVATQDPSPPGDSEGESESESVVDVGSTSGGSAAALMASWLFGLLVILA